MKFRSVVRQIWGLQICDMFSWDVRQRVKAGWQQKYVCVCTQNLRAQREKKED